MSEAEKDAEIARLLRTLRTLERMTNPLAFADLRCCEYGNFWR